MSDIFEFKAVVKDKRGTRSAREIRRNNGVPAVIYGAGQDTEMLVLNHNEVLKHLSHEVVYSHILSVNVDGKIQKTILKAVQHHPSKPKILHMDFQRVSKSDKLRIKVPLHFINEAMAAGVKAGGIITHNMVDVEVNCLAKYLPEFIEVDLSGLEIGDSIHLTEIKPPKNVEFVALAHGKDHDFTVASIINKRSDVEADVVSEEQDSADPEVKS